MAPCAAPVHLHPSCSAAAAAEGAVGTARAIVDLREHHQATAADAAGVDGVKALDMLFQRPLVNVNVLVTPST